MATILYDRYGDTEQTVVTDLTPAAAYALGMDLYHEALPHLSYADVANEVTARARDSVINALWEICIQIKATPEEAREMRIISGEALAKRSAEFVARMNKIENIEERADAIIAARGRWDGA